MMDAGDTIVTALSSAQLASIERDAAVPCDASASSAHVLAGIDEDVEADLAALGIELAPNVEREIDDPHREAMAAMLLRHAGRIQKVLGAKQAAMDLEAKAIKEHYAREMAPLIAKYARLIGHVQTLAEITEWRKKKSRATPFGSYGVKDTAATVVCTDRAAVTAWAAAERPDLVKVVATLALPEARERFTETEIAAQQSDVEWGKLKPTLDADGELPPGVQKIEARREAFAVPSQIPTEE